MAGLYFEDFHEGQTSGNVDRVLKEAQTLSHPTPHATGSLVMARMQSSEGFVRRV
jgi:hypothetical protein